MVNFSQEYIDNLIKQIYEGKISVQNLPVSLYETISNKLLGCFSDIEGNPSSALYSELRDNLYIFSGAKTYQQVRAISLLADAEHIKSFEDFKKEAQSIFEQYNSNWLRTEYNTAVGQAQMAVRWEQIEEQKHTLPYLEYSAVIDAHTSNICLPLNGVVLPVNHSFWNKNSPLNHFGCRCLLIQHDDYDAKEKGITTDKVAKEKEDEISKDRIPLFEMNPGKEKIIFQTKGEGKHPYFDVAPKDRELARNNFNLPMPNYDVLTKNKDYEILNKNLNHNISKNKITEEMLKMFPNNTKDELACINNYSGGSYFELNKKLLNDNLDVYNASFERVLNSSLEKLPLENFENKYLFRGTGLEEHYIKEYEKCFLSGAIKVEKAFFSTSFDLEVAEEFAHSDSMKKEVIFIIQNPKTARNISKISNHKYEAECLYKKGTNFRVKNFEKGVNNSYRITLEEL